MGEKKGNEKLVGEILTFRKERSKAAKKKWNIF